MSPAQCEPVQANVSLLNASDLPGAKEEMLLERTPFGVFTVQIANLAIFDYHRL
jgi:hypothetical protein